MNATKIEKLQAAIESIRALGSGYDAMIEKLQDEIAAIMQTERQASKTEQRKRATLAHNAAKSNEADIKRKITSLKRQLTMARNKAATDPVQQVRVDRMECELTEAERELALVWADYDAIMAGL